VSRTRLNQPFVVGSRRTSVGLVPGVSEHLFAADLLGAFKVRWGIGRMNYRVAPGLYALGEPDGESPVLVTANYKLTFDTLRSALPKRNLWILVLDTKGVNVWCAAGKGTFSTEEIVRQVESSHLADVVSHRRLIVPQLGAPGVAAHEVKRLCGFKVTYGPIRAQDVPAFIDQGFRALPEMRLKTFPLWERIVLIPIELVATMKYLLILAPALFFLGGFAGSGGYWANAMDHGLFAVASLLAAVAAGAVLTPILLPWLPGRAFAFKGLIAGIFVALLSAFLWKPDLTEWSSRMDILAWLFAGPALAAYLAMNFTGASTYTSLSGVKKEMRWAVPLEIAGGLIGVILWVASLFTA
jgi:CO dehydrogenase/acetyl-CoA synthase delta subunit